REGQKAQATPAANAPALVPRGGLPAMPGAGPEADALSDERRMAQIFQIQRDIARRRRHRLLMLALRLLLFVFLPTGAAGLYYFHFATPLYATHSQFQIQTADGAGAAGAGGLFNASQLATNPDSVAVQSYLTSREAMLRLDDDLGFKRAFQDP